MKRWSTSLIIVEIQVRTTTWYHLTPVRITILRNFTNNKHWTGYGEKGCLLHNWSSQVGQWVKDIPAMQEMQVRSLSQEDPLEEGMATHSNILAWRIPQSLSQEDPLEEGMATHFNILAWRIPWIEDPGGQQSIGLQRVRHD